MRKKIRKIKKFILAHQIETIVILISIITCIVGVIAVSWYIIPIMILLDLLFVFWPNIQRFFETKILKKETTVSKDEIFITDLLTSESINESIKDDVIVENTEDNEKEEQGGINKMEKSNIDNKKKKKEKIKKEKIKVPKKEKKEKKTKKKKRFRILKALFLLFLIGIILCFVAAALFWNYIVKNAPKFSEDNLYKKEASIIYDKDGVEFAKLGSEFREKITYNDLPEVLINAIIATEDSRFFQHNGFDMPRFIKASIGQVMQKVFGVGGNAGGASTLTMQISKNAFTSTESEGLDGIIRKFTDIYVSINEIEKNYTKEQILEFYINSYCLGGNVYGVEQAALTYFDKHAKDLNLSEAAIIAGLFQAPNAYNPVKNPEKAAYRRNIVLTLMVRHGYITQEEADAANAIPVEKLVKPTNASNDIYQGFIDLVVSEVKENTGNNPYTVPMEIYTTMDRRKQDVVNAAMSGQTFAWENPLVDAGVSVLDTQTGAIVAVGIGRDTSQIGLLNHATFENQIKRQIGSVAKPLFDYAPAIEYNNASPGMYVGDEPYNYTNGPEVANWDGAHYGVQTLRQALSGSRNVPALKTFQSVSNKNILEFVTNLGLSPEISGGSIHEAHSIGGYNGESPVTVSGAYAAFGNGGIYNEPHSYTKLVYRENGEVVENEYISRRAMKESTAYIAFDMLVSTTNEAMRGYGYINGWTYGAKTGTSNFTPETKAAHGLADDAINDLWCTALTDQYTISVWYGYDKIDSTYYTHFLNSGHIILLRTIASQIWERGATVKEPNSVVRVEIEKDSFNELKLPSIYTPDDMKVTEIFVKGSEPTEVSNRFTKLNDVTNFKGEYSDGVITLSWNEAKKPVEYDKEYLSKNLRRIFTKEDWHQNLVQSRYDYYDITLGGITYDIYQKVEDELKLIGTTNELEYEIELTSTKESPTYVIKTSWGTYDKPDSDGVKTTVDLSKTSAILRAELIGNNNVEITAGNNYTTGIKVYSNNVDVTSKATITYSITDKDNKVVATKLTNINTLSPGTYKIKYTAKYEKSTKSVTRTLIINENTSSGADEEENKE